MKSRKTWAFYYSTGRGAKITGGGKSTINLVKGVEGSGIERVFFSEEKGGVERVLREIGVKTVVEKLPKSIDKYDGKIFRYSVWSKMRALLGVLGYNWKVARRLEECEVDGIWVRGIRGVLLTGLAAYWRSIPLVWDIGVEHRSKGLVRVLHLIGLLLSERVVTQAKSQPDEIFGDRVARAFPSTFKTICPGITEKRRERLQRAVEDRTWNAEERTIICVGSIHPRKNQMMLLHAFSEIAPQFGGATIQVVGPIKDDAYHQKLQRFVEEEGLTHQVEFLGWREDVPELLGKSDMLVLCSHREGVPHVVREAMFAEIPVIATSVGGVPEAVEDGETGFLVGPGEVSLMRDRIKRLLEEPEMGKEMGKEGLRLAQERFSQKTWLSSYSRLLQTLPERD